MNSNSEINIIIKNVLNNIIDDVCDKSNNIKQYEIDKQNEILENECLICLEPIKNNANVILFECFHKYHAKCIKNWILCKDNSNQYKTACLLCKTTKYIIIPKRTIPQKKVNYIENSEIAVTNNEIKTINRKFKKEKDNDDLCSRRCIIC